MRDNSREPLGGRQMHFVWMQGREHMEATKPQYVEFLKTWESSFPGWTIHVWNEEQGVEAIAQVQPEALKNYQKLSSFAAKSDVCRYALLYLHGGMYVDTDMECLRPFEHDLPRDSDDFDMVVSANDYMSKFERLVGGTHSNCWFMARQGAATLKLMLDNFVKWNGVAVDVMITTMKTTGPVAFDKALAQSGDRIYEIPSRLIELLVPLHRCVIRTDTEYLRKRFPHSYAIHRMDNSWIKAKPSCFITSSWYHCRDNVDVLAFAFGIILVVLLGLSIGFAVKYAEARKTLLESTRRALP